MSRLDPDREIVTPRAGLVQRAEHAGPQPAQGRVPDLVLLAWGRRVLDAAREATRAQPAGALVAEAELFVGSWNGTPVALLWPGIGAPATGIAVEKLVAAGARAFVGVGFAGGLHPEVRSGAWVAVARAEPDEGTSAHYANPGQAQQPDAALHARLLKAIPGARSGATWTTDAPYRETVAKAQAFHAKGCVCVDMETSALLAVARHRGASAAAALLVADTLCVPGASPPEWAWTPARPGALDDAVQHGVRGALDALVTG